MLLKLFYIKHILYIYISAESTFSEFSQKKNIRVLFKSVLVYHKNVETTMKIVNKIQYFFCCFNDTLFFSIIFSDMS